MITNLAELKKNKIIFLRLQLAKKKNKKKNDRDQPFSTIYIIFKGEFH